MTSTIAGAKHLSNILSISTRYLGRNSISISSKARQVPTGKKSCNRILRTENSKKARAQLCMAIKKKKKKIIKEKEKKEYLKVFFAERKEVFPELAEKTTHVSHGMMRLEEGKMSSRTGNVITGESLINDLSDAARERAKESRAENPEELAEQVAVAAIKYQILKQASGKDIVFNREQALSLEGDSGPYLQYAHARAHQLVEKAREQGVEAKVDAGSYCR